MVQGEVARLEMSDADEAHVEDVQDDAEMGDTFACAVRAVE